MKKTKSILGFIERRMKSHETRIAKLLKELEELKKIRQTIKGKETKD